MSSRLTVYTKTIVNVRGTTSVWTRRIIIIGIVLFSLSCQIDIHFSADWYISFVVVKAISSNYFAENCASIHLNYLVFWAFHSIITQKLCQNYCLFVHFRQLFRCRSVFRAPVQLLKRWHRSPHRMRQLSVKLPSSPNSHWNAITRHPKVHHCLPKSMANFHQFLASEPIVSK